jgi:hypothetical protein
VQADVVVEDAHAAVLVQMAVRHDDVAIAADQMDTMQGVADVEPGQSRMA